MNIDIFGGCREEERLVYNFMEGVIMSVESTTIGD